MLQLALTLWLALLLQAAPSAARPALSLAELPPPAKAEMPAAWSAHRTALLAELGDGFVVWESNRTGSWRLWTMRLDGTGLHQLIPDEAGEDHIAAHISPDGKRLAYLAVEAPHTNFGANRGMSGELRVVSIARPGSGPQVVRPNARPYNQNRSVVWTAASELVYIAADGSSRRLDVESAEEVVLAEATVENFGLLVNASLTHATSGDPTFSLYRSSDRAVANRKRLRGCQPYFTHDGRFGFWVAGSGGPFRRMELKGRRVDVMLDKRSEWLPKGHGYVYYPMVSRGGGALVFGASRNEHGHFKADFDIFVAPLDRENLRVNGTAVRLTYDPGQDRFPDVHLAAEADVEAPPPGALPERRSAAAGAEHLEALHEDRVFSWENAAADNLITDPKTGLETTVEVERLGAAQIDSQGRMNVAGGAFVAELPGPLLQGPEGFTVELLMDARGRKQQEARILSVGAAGAPALILVQRDERLFVDLVTEAGTQSLDLGKLPKQRPQHVLLELVGKRFAAFRKAQPWAELDLESGLVGAGKPAELVIGADNRGAHDWRGMVEGIAIYRRALTAPEAESTARASLTRVADRKPVPRFRVKAKLKGTSTPPTLAQIAPYREALVLHEYVVLQGALEGKTVRVAHWAILDGADQEVLNRVGKKRKFVLERWEHNPQIESTFVSDTLEPSLDVPLFLDVTSQFVKPRSERTGSQRPRDG
ncbi:MAG: LamG domain-containing protein [Myxococcales bacterium]|nr:LamG domain-containing protein [Myxococcales bacterium]